MQSEPHAGGGFWKARLRSFRNAGRGLAELLCAPKNARIHLAATVAVIAAGLFLRVSRDEWCALILAIALVWMAEGANTAIELLADRVSREHDELIRRAKDIAAGAVLIAAISAAIVGAIILATRAWAVVRGG